MPKYENGLVYKLVHKEDYNNDNIYIGSTTNFRGRKAEHKKGATNPNDKNYNQIKYQYIRDNGGWENWIMVQIEKYDCDDGKELFNWERYWVEQYQLNKKLLNQNRICMSVEEIKKDKEERSKQKFICECGEILTRGKISGHLKTERHLNLLNNTFKTELIDCECGCKITKYSLQRHLKSNKHKKNLTK